MASNVGDGRTSRRDSLEDMKAKAKDMVFSLMYFANKQTNGDTNMFFHLIELAIELFQNIAFPIMFAHARWGPDINWLQVFLQYIIPYVLMMRSQISFYIIVGILSVMFIAGGMIGYTTSHRKLRFVGPLKFLSFAKHLLAGILYIPVAGILVFVAVDCETEFDDIPCNSSLFIARSTACVILLVVHFILSVFVKVTFFECEPRLKDMTCRPHTRLDALYHISRTILTILTVVLLFFGHGQNADHTTQNWILALACLAFSGALSFFSLWYMPYYHFKYCQLRAGMLLSFFWASVGLVYSQLRPESDIGLILIVTLPFMFPLAAFLVASRRRVIERMPIKDINDPFVAELRIRFKLMERGLLFYSTDNEGFARNNRSPGDLGGPIGANKPKGFMAELDEEVLAQEIAVFNEVNGMLIQFTKQMPKSCFIHIVVGTFQSVYMKNRAQALAVTAKAATLTPSPPEAFILFKRNKDLNERSIGGTLFDFIAYEKHLQNAKRNEKKAGIAMVQFWSELMKKRPSIHKLESYGSAITTAITVAQQSYVALIKISPNSPNIFRMYGSFVINILDDSKRGQDLLDHAEELEEEAQREGGYARNNDDDDADDRMQENVPRATEMDMFSDENGLITISGETNNLCEVLQANAKFLSIFGFKKHEVVGFNVTKIIPTPFADPHDTFVARYLETGFAKIIDRPRQILGLTSSKYLVSVILCVKHVVDTEGKQSFVGIVKPSRQHQFSGFVILEETFQILHATQNLAEFFGADLMNRKQNLLDALPGLNATTATDKTGIKLLWVKIDGKYELEFFGDRLCVAGTTAYIARIKFKRVHDGLGGNLIGSSMQSLGASSIGSEDNAANPMVFSVHASAAELKPSASAAQSSQQIYNSAYSENRRASGCPFVRQPSSGILKGPINGYSSPPPPSDNKKLSFMDRSRPSSTSQLKNGATLERRRTNDSDVLSARGNTIPRGQQTKSIDSDDESSRSCTPSNMARKKGGGSEKNSINGNSHRANSISGQSSRSSGKNGRNKYENQLKITVARKNAQSNRNLSIVHSLFQVALLIFCGCAVITNVTVNRIFSETSNGLSSLEKHSQLMGNIIALSDSVRTIDMHRGGGYWIRRSVFTPPLNLSKSETLYQANLLAGNRSSLFNIHGMTVNFSRPAKGKFRTVDSLEAIYTIVTVAKYTASVPFNDRLLRQRLRYVLENGPHTVFDLLNTSTTLELQSYNAKVAVQPGQIQQMCILGPLTGLLLVLLLFPVHYSINVMRREFLGIFCDIPKEIVKGIYHARMKRMIDSADRSDSEDGEGLEVLGQMHNSQESLQDAGSPIPNSTGRIPLLTAFKLFMTDKYRLGLRSLFIFAISLGYFLSSGILVQRFIDSNFLAGNSIYWSAQRLAYMKQSSYWTRERLVDRFALAALNISRVTTFAPPSNHIPPSIPDLLQNLLWVEEGVLYGNPVMNSVPITILTSSHPQFRLEYQNACISGSPADCKTYRDALLTRGLHDVFRKYVQEVETLNGMTTAMNASDMEQRAVVDERLFNLRKLDNEYITPALMESLRLYSQPSVSESQWFHSFHLALTLAFVTVLAVFYLIVIRKVVWSIRSELRQTRGLVYMLPADVLLAIPSFMKWSEQGTKPKKLKLEKVGTRDTTGPSKATTKVSMN